MSEQVGQPNPYWYKPVKHYSFWDEGSNPKLAAFGAKSKAPCGGYWILSAAIRPDNYAFRIEYAADSYNHMAQIEYFDKSCERWHELQLHLSKYENTVFCIKALADIENDLGIKSYTGD